MAVRLRLGAIALILIAGIASVRAASILTIPVKLSTGQDVSLQVEDGDTIDAAVDRFVAQYPSAADFHGSLVDAVRNEAVAARLIPELSVPVAREPDQPALLVVDVFRGDDPLAVAREAAAKAGLVGDDVEAAVGVVARFAQQARVLPLVSLPVELPDGSQAPLELFKGDDVPRVVAGFLEARGLGGEYARNLEDHVVREAQKLRLMPLISVETQMVVPGQQVAETVMVEVYEGESIDEVVAVYARAYDLPEESQARLAAVIHDRARSRRLVPAATVPTQIVDAEGQARVLDLPIFVGDTEQEAVDRFLASLGIDKATMTQEQLGAILTQVKSTAVEARLRPALVLQYDTPQGAKELDVWYGDSVEAQVGSFADAHGYAAEERNKMIAEVHDLLRLRGLEPLLVENITLPDGRVVPFRLFQGQDVEAAVASFLDREGFPEHRANLLQHVQEVGVQGRVLPELSLAARVKGKPAELHMFRRDEPDEVVRVFAQENALSPEEASDLLRALVSAAMERRLLPVARVPIEGTTLEFLLFDGDNVFDKAEEFLHAHDLADTVDLRSLVRMVQLSHVGA